MNIFWLDIVLRTCAQYHCNAHVVKMILEYAQLLFSAHWMTNPTFGHDVTNDTTFPVGRAPYKLTHKNHPCAVWTRQNKANYLMLAQLAIYLCDEYTCRYGKRHKTQDLIEWLSTHCPVGLADTAPTLPPICTQTFAASPVRVHSMDDVVREYRRAYVLEKSHLLKYKIEEPRLSRTLSSIRSWNPASV